MDAVAGRQVRAGGASSAAMRCTPNSLSASLSATLPVTETLTECRHPYPVSLELLVDRDRLCVGRQGDGDSRRRRAGTSPWHFVCRVWLLFQGTRRTSLAGLFGLSPRRDLQICVFLRDLYDGSG